MISVMILALATYPPSMMACTPIPLSSLRQNYLASLQHRLTILQLRLRGDIMELEAGDSEPHMVTSPNSKLRWGSSGCCTVVLKGKGLWLQDSKSWPRFYMYIYFQTKAAPPYVRGWRCVQDLRYLRGISEPDAYNQHTGCYFHVRFRMPKVLRAVNFTAQYRDSIPSNLRSHRRGKTLMPRLSFTEI